MELVEVKTQGHKQEQKAIMEPMPPGPYISCPQESNVYTGITWTTAFLLAKEYGDLTEDFTPKYGHKVYAAVDGRTTLVSYFYDTSG